MANGIRDPRWIIGWRHTSRINAKKYKDCAPKLHIHAGERTTDENKNSIRQILISSQAIRIHHLVRAAQSTEQSMCLTFTFIWIAKSFPAEKHPKLHTWKEKAKLKIKILLNYVHFGSGEFKIRSTRRIRKESLLSSSFLLLDVSFYARALINCCVCLVVTLTGEALSFVAQSTAT